MTDIKELEAAAEAARLVYAAAETKLRNARIAATPAPKPPYTETDIIRALVCRPGSFLNYRRWNVVRGVSWGLLPYEADLIAVSKTGTCYEVEVKVSAADYRRDRLKRKWQRWPNNLITRFWYAMPESVWEQVSDEPMAADGLGVMVFGPEGRKDVRRASTNPIARKLSQSEINDVLRLGAMRYWTRLGADDAFQRTIDGCAEKEPTP